MFVRFLPFILALSISATATADQFAVSSVLTKPPPSDAAYSPLSSMEPHGATSSAIPSSLAKHTRRLAELKPSAEFAYEKRKYLNDVYGVRDTGVYGDQSRSIARYRHPDGKPRNLCVYSNESHVFNYSMRNYQLSTDAYIEMKNADEMDVVFDGNKQGNGTKIKVQRPKPQSDGFYPLGDAAFLDDQAPSPLVLVKGIGEQVLKPPKNYTEIWKDNGSIYGGASIWAPIPLSGYVCLGHVWTTQGQTPDTDWIRCIQKKYVEADASASLILTDPESADKPLSM